MKQLLVVASVIGLLACSPQGVAQNDSSSFKRQHLERMGFVIESVNDSVIDGVYEVITDQGLVYVTADGETLIGGRLYDITGSEPQNLSEASIREMRRSDIAKVSDEAILYPAENEKYMITVFTDPTCGYCRQLHTNLEQYHKLGISVRYLAWPRSGLQGSAYQQLKTVWCSEDQQAALDAAKNDKRLPAASCDDPVDEHFALGNKFGVRGTPAIVLPSGEMLPGLVPAERLLSMMQNGQ
ncbi:bifunctional protein-disulfide isomerase/oxidoreductase DsbC [Pseudidiomarina terrestris]|uniref:Thiol:disulfide interchange protein n=1 Tax=Pseudidiomarina terrestris TaxID=2820060 RepID=A0AAW7QV02_9GAMM|nr:MULTISPECIES: bifunctional protein-disulfide isomerase/oxidoreductase DsbC [unclassified Pseudidiomarina]MDN7123569.1 bifunctional protein-disulfide isomerase/oxidoreductase DsbC [Pseudidiomarina sp. 1APP75-32.1]MDN7126641.1 bifunctional protein-disulfide isomerase/oxidoreductase DsbC [Pseudidiomarina sp. 1APR75-33.1]MDN7128707.1 bifunctional protein-disulfide isomerase/oxidoreductase DsbC [Pseudidiomarina sp. 1APR75-15]MDN7135034.1 bifunctional protein-disulfide isomerase/oxidoreductase Dsb